MVLRPRGPLVAAALLTPALAAAGGGAVVVRLGGHAPARLELACAGDPDGPRVAELAAGGSIAFRGVLAGPAAIAADGAGDAACVLEAAFAGAPPERRTFALRPREEVRFAARLGDGPRPRGELRLLERQRRGEGTLFDARALADFPSSRDVWGLPETFDHVAVVERMDSGGLYEGEPGLLGAHGSSWTQTRFRLGELDVTDPLRTGLPLFQPDLDALEALDLATGVSLGAELAGPGAVITAVPRRPGESWRGTLQGYATSDGLQSGSGGPGPPSLARFGHWRDLGAVAGGPLADDRIGLLAAARVTSGRRFERASPAALDSSLRSLFTQLVYGASRRDQLRLIAAYQDVERPHPGRALQGARDAGLQERALHLQGVWERRVRDGASLRVAAGYQLLDRVPRSGSGATLPVERLLDGPVPELIGDEARVDRLDLVARYAAAPRTALGGLHRVELGAELGRSRARLRPGPSPSTIPVRLAGLPARVWEYGMAGPESRWNLSEAALYARDRVALGSRIELDIGVRYDGSWGAARGAVRGAAWHALSPRVASRIRLTPGGRVAALAGWGRYRHRLPLHLLGWGDPSAAQGAVFRWRDRNGDGLFTESERGGLVSRVGPGGERGAIDPELGAPSTEELLLGVEARLGETWLARFVAVHRRERDLVESVNVGVSGSDYDVSSLPDPAGDLIGADDDQLLPVYDRVRDSFGRDSYLLTNPDGHSTLHEGVEFSLARWLGRRLRLVLGATASRTEGAPGNGGFRASENDQGVIGELFDEPNAGTSLRGRLFFDRAYTISLSGSYRAPGDWLAAFVTRYQDGQPFSRLVIVEDLRQGPTAIRAVPNGRHRFTYTINLDARLEKGFALGERRRIAAVLEAFNLLDNRNEVEEDVVSGAAFRAVTAVQPPRSIRLGLRFDF